MKSNRWIIVILVAINLILAILLISGNKPILFPPAYGQAVASGGDMIALVESPNSGSVVIAVLHVRRNIMLIYRNMSNRPDFELASAIDLERDFDRVGEDFSKERSPGPTQ